MRRPFTSSILLFILCLGLTSLGFSSWVFTQDSNINIDGIVDVGDIQQRNALTSNGAPKTFVIAKDGIIKDEIYVDTCGVTFEFTLNNSYLTPGTNNVIYESSLKISNITATIEPYFLNVVAGGTTYPKLNPFPTYVDTVNALTYKQNITIPIDTVNPDGKTVFGVTYNFTGNFYPILKGSLNLDLSLTQVGWN